MQAVTELNASSQNQFLRGTTEEGGGITPGGVGAGGCTLPPGVSFFGVRSLSLVLADFGTLLFSLFLFLISFSVSCFVLRWSNHLTFLELSGFVPTFRSEVKELPLLRVKLQGAHAEIGYAKL
jgi:hypothetical protein